MRHRRWLETAGILTLFGGGCVELKVDIHIPTDATSADESDGRPPDTVVDATVDAIGDRADGTPNDTIRDVPADVARDVMDGGAGDAGGDATVSFVPDGNVALPPVSRFTTITIPSGVTVTPRPGGDGTLELWASGPVVIDGTINVSGADGGDGIELGCAGGSVPTRGGGSGGATGDPLPPGAVGVRDACGAPGRGGGGRSAETGPGDGGCARGGSNGGGAGGEYCGFLASAAGGGGGGYSGGGGGSGVSGDLMIRNGQPGASDEGTGGMTGQGGGAGLGRYAGDAGVGRSAGICNGGGDGGGLGGDGGSGLGRDGSGGGGGSIGARAARDLAVATTFQTGSGGGGGGSVCLFTTASVPSCPGGVQMRPSSGGGGGGGGGALRIVSETSITVRGSLLAKGGNGGRGMDGRSGGGGGGSGGVIYLQAPSITVTGTVDASGGDGGASARTAGMLACDTSGGVGGLGRIRLSVRVATCTLTGGTFSPSLASGCALTPDGGVPERVYIGEYPN